MPTPQHPGPASRTWEGLPFRDGPRDMLVGDAPGKGVGVALSLLGSWALSLLGCPSWAGPPLSGSYVIACTWDAWVRHCLSVWMPGCMHASSSGRVDARMRGCVSACSRMHGCMHASSSGRVDAQMRGCVIACSRMPGCMHASSLGRLDAWMRGCVIA